MSVTVFAFYLFAVSALTGGLFTVISRNPVHSVLWLILSFISSAGLFVLLGSYLYFNQFPPIIALAGGLVTIFELLLIALGRFKKFRV